eukprot:2791073-Pleurochrysis_carterae.AAC.3
MPLVRAVRVYALVRALALAHAHACACDCCAYIGDVRPRWYRIRRLFINIAIDEFRKQWQNLANLDTIQSYIVRSEACVDDLGQELSTRMRLVVAKMSKSRTGPGGLLPPAVHLQTARGSGCAHVC